MNPTVTLVVVAYRRPDALDRLVAAVAEPGIEVIVVNAGADARVREVTARHAGSSIIDVDNLGYAAAVNAGGAKATTEVVVFTNDDVSCDAGTVHALADRVRLGPADVVVPAVRDSSGARSPTIAALPTPRNLLVEWALLPDRPVRGLGALLKVQKWRRPVHAEPVVAASAVTVATRTALLAEVPLPEQYFLYWEESDWFLRLARRGVQVLYEPSLSVVHDGGRTDVRPDKARLMAANAVRCVYDTQGARAAWLAWFVVVLWHLRLLVVDVLRAVGSPSPLRWSRVGARRVGLVAAVRARSLIR